MSDQKQQLTFKQYLDSKEKLREAVKTTPQRTVEYSVKKYCRIPVGPTKENRTYISLKPKHKIVVEWLYQDIDNPTVVNLAFEGATDVTEKYPTFWTSGKLTKWLQRNAIEESPTV